eukprot:5224377-Amphidinium_carterae.1
MQSTSEAVEQIVQSSIGAAETTPKGQRAQEVRRGLRGLRPWWPMWARGPDGKALRVRDDK